MFTFNERRKNKHKKLIVVPYIFLCFDNWFLKNCSETRLFTSTIIFEIKKKNIRMSELLKERGKNV